MTHIVVSSLSRLAETAERYRASHLLTVINADTLVERPSSIAEDRHLFLGFNDITVEMEGFTPPGQEHVERIIDFGRKWDARSPLLIHCFAGISRSTAAALMIALALRPERDDEELAQALRRAAPSATPNIRMIDFADEILKREGRFSEAVRAIGRGENAFEGTPFVLEI